MSPKNRNVFICLILLLGVVSVTWKVSYKITNTYTSNQHERDLITRYMAAKDIFPADRFNLNQDGSFIAYVYRHASCDGGWIITPMSRNSEGVNLFSRQAIYRHYSVGPVFYMLQRKTYNTFPSFAMWVAQKVRVLKHTLGFKTLHVTTVFAFRSFGDCHATLF